MAWIVSQLKEMYDATMDESFHGLSQTSVHLNPQVDLMINDFTKEEENWEAALQNGPPDRKKLLSES